MVLASDYLKGSQIVVIGAGAVGAALTYRLAQAGARVTAVERLYPGSGTTSKSFAWLNGFNKPPKHYHRLNVMSVRDHLDLADELDGDWVHIQGGLHWEHAARKDSLGTLRSKVKRLRDWGFRVDETTPEAAMRELEPDLWIDPEKVPEVYYCPREGTLDPVPMVHGALRAAVVRYGATYENGNVVQFLGRPGEVAGVTLEDGRQIAADLVINAAGPQSDSVAELAGVKISIDHTLGFTLVTPPAPVCIKAVIHSPEVTIRPDGGGRLMLRHEEVDGHLVDDQPLPSNSPVVQEVMERARIVVPNLKRIPAESIRTGVRPMPKDGKTIVGFEPEVSGLYTVVTHSGVTLSARLALLITEELTGGDVAELEPYRPGRFAQQ